MSLIAVIGAGLGGCECALHLARAGFEVALFEQKPNNFSPAHHSKNLAELVCSNSLRSDELTSGVGLLKQELRDLGSAVMETAGQTRVPAGKALAVDRTLFARRMTELVEAQPGIRLVRREITSLGDPELERAARIVIAAGPLLAGGLCAEITGLTDRLLYFYDAVAPVISGDSVDKNTAFTGSRGETGDDYLNCPMTKEEYLTFYTALREARRTPARDFEKETHFEGCMPIEALADRGERTLAFGPLKPVGFVDPRSGKRPWALVQLRAENLNRTAFNLVGCQTKLVQSEQARVFRLIPGLEQAEFLRYGSMHRNSYVDAPQVLTEELALKMRPHIHIAGQLSGVEGYVESAACGLWLGMLLAARLGGHTLLPPRRKAPSARYSCTSEGPPSTSSPPISTSG